MLDRHVVSYERQVIAEHRARPSVQLEVSTFDEADNGERGKSLVPLAMAKRVSISLGIP
ncbi:MAG: hypothetical protein ABR609_08540 [Acidimicrobiia bacterium]